MLIIGNLYMDYVWLLGVPNHKVIIPHGYPRIAWETFIVVSLIQLLAMRKGYIYIQSNVALCLF